MKISSNNSTFSKKDFSDKVALIDADRYKHTACYNVFKELDKGREHSKELLHNVVDDLLWNDIFSRFDCKAHIFCFSAPSGDVFRNHIAQEKQYKGNRKGKADLYDYPQKWDDMTEVYRYIDSLYTTLLFKDLEADDILSILQDDHNTFIFSHDKDLKQVVGFHYNMDYRRLEYTTESEGVNMLICQMLTGDAVDAIPGLKGFGPKALEDFREEHKNSGDTEKLMMALKKYIDKHGVLNGMDIFSEMWHLLSMRTRRGAYMRERYQKAFVVLEELIQKDADG